MIEQIKNINSLEELQRFHSDTFGKNGTMTLRLKAMKDLSLEERAALNLENAALRAAFATKQAEMEDAALNAALESQKLDPAVQMPGRESNAAAGKIHPLSKTLAEISGILKSMGYKLAIGPEIEDDFHNFTALNTPAHHPARDMQDTFFLPNGNVMRTQTSAVQIRAIEKNGVPIKIFCPGATYRNDMDATHIPAFYQIEGLWIDKADAGVNLSRLVSDIKEFLGAFFNREITLRVRPSYFPFTEPSIEFDMLWDNGKWLELGGAGMVHPNVLKNVGVDSDEFQGFAFGLGIDRLVMLKNGLTDLRKFYEGDIRWLNANGF